VKLLVLVSSLASVTIPLTGATAAPSPDNGGRLVAARDRAKPARTGYVDVVVSLPIVEVRGGKKREARAVQVGGGEGFEARLLGPGKLTVNAFQLLGGDDGNGVPVRLELTLDGEAQGPITFKGVRLAGASVVGSPGLAPSKPRSTTINVPAGPRVVTVRAPAGGATVLVELEYVPRGSRKPAGISYSAPPAVVAGEPDLAPLPAAEPALAPLPATTETPAVAEAKSPPPAAVAVGSDVERRVAAGEARDGIVGTYAPVTVRDAESGAPEELAAVTPDHPYVFVVDGPGVATVRAYWLAAPGETPTPGRLTILENDVLLTAVELDTPLSTNLTVDGAPGLRASEVKEYRLTVGPKLGRFTIQPTEGSPRGVAVVYHFAAREKSTAMALSLDIGNDLGVVSGDVAGQTMLTEVAIREKLVVVPGNDLFGFSAVGGAIIPARRTTPAQTAGLELRVSPPWAGRMFSASVDAQGLRQQLAVKAADPYGGTVSATGSVLGLTVMGGVCARFGLQSWLALYATGGGGAVWVRATGGRGAEGVVATSWLPAARATAGVEVRLGPGWLAADGGYLWVPARKLTGVFDSYSPGGAPLALRYRLGL